jgi:hypothetical protein
MSSKYDLQQVMYGNVTVSAILSLIDWPAPFHDKKERNNRKYCFPIQAAKRRT